MYKFTPFVRCLFQLPLEKFSTQVQRHILLYDRYLFVIFLKEITNDEKYKKDARPSGNSHGDFIDFREEFELN